MLLNQSYQFIKKLPEGPLDIIGDIHGEWKSLKSLLKTLNYDEYGRHFENRHLVFLGDLCDRGLNSPLVVNWVINGVLRGDVFAVLGNHEINLLMNYSKDGSGWFFPSIYEEEKIKYGSVSVVEENEKIFILEQLNQFPIALEREDIRIIHACWKSSKIDLLRDLKSIGVREAYQNFDNVVREYRKKQKWYDDFLKDSAIYSKSYKDSKFPMPFLDAMAESDLLFSEKNPLRMVSSGMEKKVTEPYFKAGRWRFTDRVKWWDLYQEDIPVIFGHYWRSWNLHHPMNSLFKEKPNDWLGLKKNTFCIDYSIGALWQDRHDDVSRENSSFRLAAMRWPEKKLVFDNGDEFETIKSNRPAS